MKTQLFLLIFIWLLGSAAHSQQCFETKTTFYNPKVSNKMQGGAANRFSGSRRGQYEEVHTIQNAIVSGRPVTLAMDYLGKFGASCNQRDSRCTLLVCNPGFDRTFPEYRIKFKNVPKNCFLGIVEDTGGRFKNRGTSKMDLPSSGKTRGIKHTTANPAGTNKSSFQIVTNPCGKGRRARQCDLSARWSQTTHLEASLCPLPKSQKVERERRAPRSSHRQRQQSRSRTQSQPRESLSVFQPVVGRD